MNNWYCVVNSGEYEGEEFFIQCDTAKEAKEILKTLDFCRGERVHISNIPWTDEEAERYGLDTY